MTFIQYQNEYFSNKYYIINLTENFLDILRSVIALLFPESTSFSENVTEYSEECASCIYTKRYPP